MPRIKLDETESKALALSPVQKERLITEGGTRSSRFAVILDPDGVRKEVGIVSEDYKLVPNRFAYDTALDVIRKSRMRFEPHSIAFDGKHYRQRWFFPEVTQEPQVGDMIRCGLDVVNSYDGTTQFGISFIAERLKCHNGMMVDFILGATKFRHWGNGDKWESELGDAVNYLGSLGNRSEQLLPHINKMLETIMPREAIQKVFADLETPDSLLAPVYRSLEGDTQWDLYNAFTKTLSEKNTIRNDNLNRHISQYFFGVRN